MFSKASKVIPSIIVICILAALANVNLSPAFAANPSPQNAVFEVSVNESLSVSITTPEDWAKGDAGDLLRNKITLNVHSNNANGFTASMATNTNNTDLVHTTVATTTGNTTIPTLSSNWTRSNTGVSDFWGYSLNDAEETGTYSPLVGSDGSPITLISRSESIDPASPITSRDIYFGAKASANKVAGTYSNTVVISVVSGITTPDDPTDPNNNPVIPHDPVTPTSNPGATDPAANPSYSTTYDRTAYTSTSSDGTSTTTTTTISEGNAVGSYANPHGIKRSGDADIAGNAGLTAALAVATVVAAGTGTFFFILAKRKKDDDEEE